MALQSDPVVYDRAGYQALRTAYDKAKADPAPPHRKTVQVIVQGKPCSYSLHYASVLLDSLAEAFAAPDEPRRPNLEGDEGQ